MGIVKRINSSLDLNETLSIIMNEAKAISKSEASSLMLIDHETQELYFNIATGETGEVLNVNVATDKKGEILKEIRIPLGQGVCGSVAVTGKSLIINDAETDPRIFKQVDEKTKMTTRNLLCVPLTVKGDMLGVLEVLNKVDAGGYTQDDLEQLEAFSDVAAMAINNRELFQKMERRAQEAFALYRLSKSINECDAMDALLMENINIVRDVMEANRVSLIIREADAFRFKAGVGISNEVLKKGKVTAYNNVLGIMMETGRGIFSQNINQDERFNRSSLYRYKDHSFVAVPLKLKNIIFAFLCVTERRRKQPYQETDLLLLEMLAQQISENYNHSRLSEQYQSKQKLEAELSITAQMQRDILPKKFPSDGDLDIAACNVPATVVGGDFYDFLPLGKGKYGLIIADVSGKGVPAGLFMAISRSVLRVYFTDQASPATILTLANRYLYEDSQRGMFVTTFCCLIDTVAKEITYANAGHFEQYLLSQEEDNTIKSLHTRGKPLGIVRDEIYTERKTGYTSGDVLLLYTDGVTEAINSHFEEYGESRLKKNLLRFNDESSAHLLKYILDDILLFQGEAEQFDDITLMAIRF